MARIKEKTIPEIKLQIEKLADARKELYKDLDKLTEKIADNTIESRSLVIKLAELNQKRLENAT